MVINYQHRWKLPRKVPSKSFWKHKMSYTNHLRKASQKVCFKLTWTCVSQILLFFNSLYFCSYLVSTKSTCQALVKRYFISSWLGTTIETNNCQYTISISNLQSDSMHFPFDSGCLMDLIPIILDFLYHWNRVIISSSFVCSFKCFSLGQFLQHRTSGNHMLVASKAQ